MQFVFVLFDACEHIHVPATFMLGEVRLLITQKAKNHSNRHVSDVVAEAVASETT